MQQHPARAFVSLPLGEGCTAPVAVVDYNSVCGSDDGGCDGSGVHTENQRRLNADPRYARSSYGSKP